MRINLLRLAAIASACLPLSIGLGFVQHTAPYMTGAGWAQAAEHIRVPPNVCDWEKLDWKDLNGAERHAWVALGWTKKLWDGGTAKPPSSDKNWSDLGPAELAAATSLGYTAETWNKDSCSAASDSIRVVASICDWEKLDWQDLNAAEQRAWAALGWTKELWDAGTVEPPSSDKAWGDLGPEEQAAATSLGYTAQTWAADNCSATPARGN